MAQGIEVDTAEEWMYDTLHGDSLLLGLVSDVYNTQAPPSTPFPFVVYQQMSGTDLIVVGAQRVWTAMMFMVKVVGQTADFGDLKAAAARVDTLLHAGDGTPLDGTVWACVRESVIRIAEDGPGGKQYRHAGGVYRVYAS